MNTFRLILIFAVIIAFVVLMMKKKIPTILALPIMGFLVALIASVGTLPLMGLFNYSTMVNGASVDNPGIFSSVITDGVKMMAGAVSTIIFASAFSKLLMKQKVIEKIIKTAAEYAGDRPLTLALVFYVIISIIFMAIGGLGGVILVGSIVLPIMLSAGLKPIHAASIFLLSLNSGGIVNPMNYSTYIALLAPSMGNNTQLAQQTLVSMSWVIYAIAFLVPIAYIFIHIKPSTKRVAWSANSNINLENAEVSKLAMIAPIIPVVVLILSAITKYTIPSEIAIVIGIIYVLIVTKSSHKLQLLSQSFVEGVQDVAGAILLMIGIGILIKGFQYSAVQVIIGPAIEVAVSYLKNPMTYVIGFTIGSLLALYRGPMNTFGIGGALPALFGAAGFSPVAIIWALRANGNMQGFGDPTNSHNIWIADFVNVDVNEILKNVLVYGLVISFLVLSYAVFIAKIQLGV